MRFILFLLGIISLTLSSCGLVRSTAQLPGRTIQSLSRTIGIRLITTEVTPNDEAKENTEKTRSE